MNRTHQTFSAQEKDKLLREIENSRGSTRETLARLGISKSTYYGWKSTAEIRQGLRLPTKDSPRNFYLITAYVPSAISDRINVKGNKHPPLPPPTDLRITGCVSRHLLWHSWQKNLCLPDRQASIVRSSCGTTRLHRAHRNVAGGFALNILTIAPIAMMPNIKPTIQQIIFCLIPYIF